MASEREAFEAWQLKVQSRAEEERWKVKDVAWASWQASYRAALEAAAGVADEWIGGRLPDAIRALAPGQEGGGDGS